VRFSGSQYSETNVMHFLLGLLRIKGLYMFRALRAHPQEALHKRHLVYRVRSVGCYQDWSGTEYNVHHVGFTILTHYYERNSRLVQIIYIISYKTPIICDFICNFVIYKLVLQDT
jgi:hypothetical protein